MYEQNCKLFFSVIQIQIIVLYSNKLFLDLFNMHEAGE